ncbi:MAG: alpha/beta fold hydrolase [Kiritimatiellae bacterium]|nr:alpha/beta fold hydrolase [Kiritimatiellia bacterium]
MKKQIMVSMVLAAVCCALAESSPLEARIAEKHKILTSDTWGAGHRIIFDFNGRKGWVIEPATPAPGRPWVWTMQWMGAFLERTGAPDLVKRGYYHVHLAAYDTRANREGLLALADFQDYLVRELGFAPKANLIGMSWGGFYSVRYACAYPQNVARIYLDAPLLNFDGYCPPSPADPKALARLVGPWAKHAPADGQGWTPDPEMPVNLAASLARTGIPVLLLYGGKDKTVNPEMSSVLFMKRFREAGGDLKVECRPEQGHHPHGLAPKDVHRILEFFQAE